MKDCDFLPFGNGWAERDSCASRTFVYSGSSPKRSLPLIRVLLRLQRFLFLRTDDKPVEFVNYSRITFRIGVVNYYPVG